MSITQTFGLPAITSIRECAALKQQLLERLESPDAVLIDITAVESIDAAALQLLFAFSRERNAADLSTVWQGDNPTFRTSAAAMGLQIGPQMGECTHGT